MVKSSPDGLPQNVQKTPLLCMVVRVSFTWKHFLEDNNLEFGSQILFGLSRQKESLFVLRKISACNEIRGEPSFVIDCVDVFELVCLN